MNINQLIKNLFQTNILIKIIAILYAYFLWLMVSQTLYTTMQIQMPILLSDTPNNIKIKNKKEITVILGGKRKDLLSFLSQKPCISINIIPNDYDKDSYSITEQEIFLPEEIKLIDYNPSKIPIEITQE